MNRIELQAEIQQILEKAPDNVLTEVLRYLQEINNLASEDLQRTRNLNKILEEDRELLEKLAS
ncbi:MAG TPA: hypothetical protein VHS96_12890 [Bacteroidia bacterium]|nr:hypothetical protein [Bacteroidia bacterium]